MNSVPLFSNFNDTIMLYTGIKSSVQLENNCSFVNPRDRSSIWGVRKSLFHPCQPSGTKHETRPLHNHNRNKKIDHKQKLMLLTVMNYKKM